MDCSDFPRPPSTFRRTMPSTGPKTRQLSQLGLEPPQYLRKGPKSKPPLKPQPELSQLDWEPPQYLRKGPKFKPPLKPQPELMKRSNGVPKTMALPLGGDKSSIKAESLPPIDEKLGETHPPNFDESRFVRKNPKDIVRLKNVELWEIEHSWTSIHKLLHGSHPIHTNNKTFENILVDSPPKYRSPSLVSAGDGEASNSNLSSQDAHMWGEPSITSLSYEIGYRASNPAAVNGCLDREKVKLCPAKTIANPYLSLAYTGYLVQTLDPCRPKLRLDIKPGMISSKRNEWIRKPQHSRFWVKKPFERRIQQIVNSL